MIHERKAIYNEEDLPIEFCIIKNEKELCINIDKSRFHKIYTEELQRQYDAHWEDIKEESKRTHTSNIYKRLKGR